MEDAASPEVDGDDPHAACDHDDFGEAGAPSEDLHFVEKAELDAVKKEIEELHRANSSLQSLVTDTQS